MRLHIWVHSLRNCIWFEEQDAADGFRVVDDRLEESADPLAFGNINGGKILEENELQKLCGIEDLVDGRHIGRADADVVLVLMVGCSLLRAGDECWR